MGHADLGALDLARTRLAPQMGGDFPHVGDPGGTDGVPLRLEPARHVDRHGAIAPGGSGVEEVDGSALLAQHQVVVVDEFGGGEAVVQFHQVEVRGADTGLLVGHGGGVAGQGVHIGQDLAGLLPRVGGEDRGGNLYGPTLLLERERAQFGPADHNGRRGPVAVGRAHGPGVRIGDHEVAHDLLEAHFLGVGSERVQCRVCVVLLTDSGEELKAGAAVAVAVLHADLGEDARHDVGADPAVDGGDGPVAPGGGERA